MHVEEGAVLEQLDGVANVNSALRQARKRRHQLGERRVAIDLKVRVAMPPDRPDDHDENHDREDENDDQRDRDRHFRS